MDENVEEKITLLENYTDETKLKILRNVNDNEERARIIETFKSPDRIIYALTMIDRQDIIIDLVKKKLKTDEEKQKILDAMLFKGYRIYINFCDLICLLESDQKKVDNIFKLRGEGYEVYRPELIITSLKSDEEKLNTIEKMNIKSHELCLIALGMNSDDCKIKCLKNMNNDDYRLSVVKTMKSDDKKIEALKYFDRKDMVIKGVVDCLDSDDKKMEYAKEYGNYLICSLTSDDRKIKFLSQNKSKLN